MIAANRLRLGPANRLSMGIVVFGRVVAATVIGIFSIPPFYVLIQTMNERIKGAPGTAARSPV